MQADESLREDFTCITFAALHFDTCHGVGGLLLQLFPLRVFAYTHTGTYTHADAYAD